MEREEMLEALEDLLAEMVYVEKYGGGRCEIPVTHTQGAALNEAIVLLRGERVLQASDMPVEEEDNA